MSTIDPAHIPRELTGTHDGQIIMIWLFQENGQLKLAHEWKQQLDQDQQYHALDALGRGLRVLSPKLASVDAELARAAAVGWSVEDQGVKAVTETMQLLQEAERAIFGQQEE